MCTGFTSWLWLYVAVTCVIGDNFEDGVINDSLWKWGGEKWGWQKHPPGDGNWEISHQEVVDPTDGYLKMRVKGPPSGNTYGAEAWVRTKHNFNDGNFWTINFTWEPDFDDWHCNSYYIQITDGYIPSVDDFHWPSRDYPGTENLLWSISHGDTAYRGRNFQQEPSPGKLTWSIVIDPDFTAWECPPCEWRTYPVAYLYDQPNGTGWFLDKRELDPDYPWYVRFMVSDGTSGGFPAGDAWLNLYDFCAVPEPATVLLLGAGGLALLRKRRGRRI